MMIRKGVSRQRIIPRLSNDELSCLALISSVISVLNEDRGPLDNLHFAVKRGSLQLLCLLFIMENRQAFHMV